MAGSTSLCLRVFPAALILFLGLLPAAGAAMPATPACDRSCLYAILDDYLGALRAHDPAHVRWAAQPFHVENYVAMQPGDGVWTTLTAIDGSYQMRFADVAAGEVALFGVLDERGTRSPFALRLKVNEGVVAESEIVVARPQDAGVPFVNADLAPIPVWSEVVSPARRVPRQQMVDIANGYFETLQLNDGTLRTAFTDDCNRRENGTQTTNNTAPGAAPIWKYGCAEQFRLGAYRYDDRLRERRFLAVDEELGIVLAGGFIDHSGRLTDFQLTDGSTRQSNYLRPHSFALLEAFKIVDGRIRQVEAVFFSVPYNMPSAWTYR